MFLGIEFAVHRHLSLLEVPRVKDYVLKTRLQQKLVAAVGNVLLEAEGDRALKEAEAKLR
jgi:hypothetical protein